MMQVLKDNSPALAELRETGQTYSRYDCFVPDKVWVELKHRGNATHYADTLIEYDKYDYLTGFGVTAVYAVYSCGKLYVFNLSKLKHNGYDFGWENRYCNKTTEFSSRHKISKRVGYIDWEMADRVIQCDL